MSGCQDLATVGIEERSAWPQKGQVRDPCCAGTVWFLKRVCQCQYPGCDIVALFSKLLPFGKTRKKGMQELCKLFLRAMRVNLPSSQHF